MKEYDMQCIIYDMLLVRPDIDALEREVNFGSYYADIAYITHGQLYALKLKLSWCHRAIEQAERYVLYGANRSAVVTRRQRIPKAHMKDFEEHGIGLGFFREPEYTQTTIGCIINSRYARFIFPIEWIVMPKLRPNNEYTEVVKQQIEFTFESSRQLWLTRIAARE